ncbi:MULTISPECIES: chemotaxis protein CheW [Xanthomonas]|uniref:chemotaxis protein CheW n=1 Tax=Xanthomonas TaxID=338 RepID=UPI001C47DD57|nr:chemotaxis protein CheW [Xanthomonas euvesicatoria]MBV6783959.1 chemotaxis protein CheW [Xanthomonas campestris pv. uppalii]MBV6809478.1 chemotaxis protein CheW [Xanthomonas campestris pv. pennamericanum]MBV6860675.1 chemotaxis protein CheW [Xanthomonas campestris pv. blepharidis]MBV6886088.1 chemotaxis protein CheW [Xanthomonas campestris pv. spermacoces]MBV6894521.1 chemotaxis protein CheW [Xanthomonas campestris pv. ionidii]
MQALPATDRQVPSSTAPQQYLTFLLGREMFGLGILSIKEIIQYRVPTDVPTMPPALRGVINLRGAVVPVVDLQQRFGRNASAITKRSCIVIVEIAHGQLHQVLGLLVDAVSEVLEIAPADIVDTPSFGAGIARDFIHAMGKIGERFVILLDADAVLGNDTLAQLPAAELAA